MSAECSRCCRVEIDRGIIMYGVHLSPVLFTCSLRRQPTYFSSSTLRFVITRRMLAESPCPNVCRRVPTQCRISNRILDIPSARCYPAHTTSLIITSISIFYQTSALLSLITSCTFTTSCYHPHRHGKIGRRRGDRVPALRLSLGPGG